MKLTFYLATMILAAWLLLEIDNPLKDWVMQQYELKVSAGIEKEMNWRKP
jgi:hypothetical protein